MTGGAVPAAPGGRPRVLVVIPVWNAEATLVEALDSVLAQEAEPFEVLAVDDGSTDGSPTLLDRKRDPRLTVHRLEHRGLCAALNHAVQYASTGGYEYLVRMDSDDISAPGRLAALVAYMDVHPQCAAVSSNCDYFTSDGKGGGRSTISVRRRQIAFEIRHGLRGLIHGACCFRVAALVAVGAYREHFKGAEDTDLFTRLAERFELGNVPQYLYRIRSDPGSKSRLDMQRNILYCRYAIDCARRRRRGLPERSFESFAAWAGRYSLSLRMEYWALALWELSHRGGWRKALIPAAALLSPVRVSARVLRVLLG